MKTKEDVHATEAAWTQELIQPIKVFLEVQPRLRDGCHSRTL